MYEVKIQGSKYSGFKPAAEVAKLIRAEIKDAKATGLLPKELKVSVRSSSFAGGQAIDCTLSGLPVETVWQYDSVYNTKIYTQAAKEICEIVEDIRNQWNLDRSESQVDYFDVMYYGRAEWDWRV
jgi:hypothetical protein